MAFKVQLLPGDDSPVNNDADADTNTFLEGGLLRVAIAASGAIEVYSPNGWVRVRDDEGDHGPGWPKGGAPEQPAQLPRRIY